MSIYTEKNRCSYTKKGFLGKGADSYQSPSLRSLRTRASHCTLITIDLQPVVCRIYLVCLYRKPGSNARLSPRTRLDMLSRTLRTIILLSISMLFHLIGVAATAQECADTISTHDNGDTKYLEWSLPGSSPIVHCVVHRGDQSYLTALIYRMQRLHP